MTRRYLLDTGPAFDFLFKRKGIDVRVEEARRNGARIGICMPGFGEIVAGLEASDSREKSWAIARRRLGKTSLLALRQGCRLRVWADFR